MKREHYSTTDVVFRTGSSPRKSVEEGNLPKRMLRLTLYGMTHLLYSVMIMAGYQGQEQDG